MICRKSSFKYILLLAVLVVYCVFFLVFIFGLDAKVRSHSDLTDLPKSVVISSNWQFQWGDSPVDSDGKFLWLDSNSSKDGWNSFQFPGRPKNNDNYTTVWVRAILPEGNWQQATLRFRAPQQALVVYIDGKPIYSYGNIESDNKVRTPGSIWHLAKLPSNFGGKTVTFRLHSPFPHYTGYLIETEVGDRSTHLVNIVRETGMSFIFGSLFILIGIGMLLLQISGSHEWRFLIYLGLSFICMGGWYIAESKLLQLFINAPVSMTYFANFFIFLMPVWLLIYVDRAFKIKSNMHRMFLRIMWITHAMLALTAFTFDMAGFVSSLYFDKILHIMFPITMVLIIYTIISKAKSGIKGSKLVIISILVLGITGLFDTFTIFYNTFPLLKLFKISYIGMLFFLFTLLINVGRELKGLYENLKINSIENETNYKSLFTNMTEGFTYNKVETDIEGRINSCIILESNDAFVEKSGLEREVVIGSDIYSLFPEIKALNIGLSESYDESAPVLDLCAAKNPIRLGDKWYKLSAFCPKKDHLSMIFSDITVMKNAEETIRHQAYTDSMTGFFNRTYFEETMLSMHGIMKDIKPLSIIAIDIDGLKITNDTFGHNAGDNLLKQAATIISSVFKSCGIISRVGGDEFCIILQNTNYSTAQCKAEDIARATEAINRLNPIVPISMSIGMATSSKLDDEDIYTLYKRADDNMYRYKISQSSSEKSKVIDMLLSALSERDYVSQGHVERLAELCTLMSDALNLHDVQKRNLVLLSKMHDLGKIGIPDEILNKPDRLTPDEYNKMKQHVKIGYNIASRSRELVTIAPLILHHHEHWNGKGYPDSLKGREIPLECRILGILDAFDAMTNDRPYHKGISEQEALDEISKCAGMQFDPDLANKFIEILSKNYPI